MKSVCRSAKTQLQNECRQLGFQKVSSSLSSSFPIVYVLLVNLSHKDRINPSGTTFGVILLKRIPTSLVLPQPLLHKFCLILYQERM